MIPGISTVSVEFTEMAKTRKYISRGLQADLTACLEESPIVALIGPRQCGKSTLAKMVRADYPASVYLDLENPQDLSMLDDPVFFFSRTVKNSFALMKCSENRIFSPY